MAKFNDKVLCLFNKDYKQLKKEMQRRGMVYETREKAIAKSIWKDAYDAGFTEGKNFAIAMNNVVRNCPAIVAAMQSPKSLNTVCTTSMKPSSIVLNSLRNRPVQSSGCLTVVLCRM